MRHTVNKKTIALTAAAVTLAAGLQVGSAHSYFTAYNTAAGSVKLELGTPGTNAEETFDNWVKTVTVTNNGNAPCYVRLRVVAGDLYAANMTCDYDAQRWTLQNDGYYYYGDILQPGEDAGEFKINVPEPAADADDFNVIVVEDRTPVVYNAAGVPYADWNLKAAPVSTGTDQNQNPGQNQNPDQNPDSGADTD